MINNILCLFSVILMTTWLDNLMWWQQYYKSIRQTKIPRNNHSVSLHLILVHKCKHDTGPETVVSIFQPDKDRLYMHLHHFCWTFRLSKLESLGEDPIVKKCCKWPSPPPAEGFLLPDRWSLAHCAQTAMDLCSEPMDVAAAFPFPCSTSSKTECGSQRPTQTSKDADTAGHRVCHRECTCTVVDPEVPAFSPMHKKTAGRQGAFLPQPQQEVPGIPAAASLHPQSCSFSGSSLQVSLCCAGVVLLMGGRDCVLWGVITSAKPRDTLLSPSGPFCMPFGGNRCGCWLLLIAVPCISKYHK